MTDRELTREEWQAVVAARNLMAEALQREHPALAHALYIVAVAGALADIVSKSPAGPAIIELVNQQLAGAGLRVVETSRN